MSPICWLPTVIFACAAWLEPHLKTKNWAIPWEDMRSWKNNMTCQNPRMVRCAGLHATTSSKAVPPTVGTCWDGEPEDHSQFAQCTACSRAQFPVGASCNVHGSYQLELLRVHATGLLPSNMDVVPAGHPSGQVEILKRFRWFNAVNVWNRMMT